MTDKLGKLLRGKIEDVIEERKKGEELLGQGKAESLQKIITYWENGKDHMRYDIYLAQGCPMGSGVVEGACKNLVKDRMEQCGMRWMVSGAEAVLSMRSIPIAQERGRLYSALLATEESTLAA